MFIFMILKKLFGKKERYSLKFSDRPVRGLHVQIARHADILHDWALEARKKPYRFDRKTFESILTLELNSKNPEPVYPN